MAHPVEIELDHRLRVWRRGLVVALLLRTGAWLLLALAMVALYDLFLPIPDAARLVLGIGLPLVAVGFFLVKWTGIRRTGRREMAIIADALLDDPRRSLLGAYELLQSGQGGFLQGKSVADAQMGFWKLPATGCRPKQILRAARIVAGVILGLLFILILLKPQAVPTLVARLLAPFSDIPPYSQYVFSVSPENPKVLYGTDIDLTTHITGPAVKDPVRLITRFEGQVEEGECFRGADNTFIQKLEKVVRPVEFCFAVGKARSKWHRVDVLLEPRFTLARVTIAAPAYTHEPVREIVLGHEEIKAVEGATAALAITSNRPLSTGELTITPLAPQAEARTITGTQTGPHTVRFEWPMLSSATLRIQIHDVQGTPAPEPLEIKQTVEPDGKPHLALQEPGSHSLATPTTLIPITGEARDDYGLRRISLVRTLQGFRERPEELPVPKGDRKYGFQSKLDLAALGVQPGEVIELYLEGRDENPSLSGIQTSDVSRIEIITEEEYAQMLRDRITLDELLARLQKIQEQRDRIHQALVEARDATENPEETLKKSTETVRDAAETLNQLSQDFPAFDLENAMQSALAESAAQATNAADRMAQLTHSQPDLATQVESIRQQFEKAQSNLDEMLAQQPEIESIGRVMQQANAFAQLVQHQRELANWIERMKLSNQPDADALNSAAKLQQELRQMTGQMPDQMREAANQIPEGSGYEKLKADALSFADQLEDSGATESMDNATTAAQNTNAPAASQASRQAYETLAELMPDDGPDGNQFAGLCRGQCQNLFPPKSQAARTLAQALDGMGKRGRTGGLGSGDPATDGYITQGFSPLEVPVFGPQRIRLSPPPRPTVTSFGSIRDGMASAPVLETDNQTTVAKPAEETTGGASISQQNIPEKYRSAVRKYFSQPTTQP